MQSPIICVYIQTFISAHLFILLVCSGCTMNEKVTAKRYENVIWFLINVNSSIWGRRVVWRSAHEINILLAIKYNTKVLAEAHQNRWHYGWQTTTPKTKGTKRKKWVREQAKNIGHIAYRPIVFSPLCFLSIVRNVGKN